MPASAALLLLLAPATANSAPAASPCYRVANTYVDPKPVLSFMGGNSAFGQVFNPSWIEASPDGKVKAGLIVRTQNCTVGVYPAGCGLGGGAGPDPEDPESPKRWSGNHSCCACNMRSVNDSVQKRSILTFSPLGAGGDGAAVAAPEFGALGKQSIVFEPVDQPPLNDDFKGTEDPRVALDKKTGTYYMFYTCFHKGSYAAGPGGGLCLASTKDPTVSSGWARHGPPFEGNHKSGALLIRDTPPHYLISGAGEIHISRSDDLLTWTLGPLFINDTAWGNPNVEAGPPPMLLSDGNYVFFHNSWGGEGVPQPGYQPAWVILDGKDPSHILARAPAPLWRPDKFPWMAGDTSPDTVCNVPQVSFLEAAHPAGDKKDAYRLYYGGSDAVVGTGVVSFERVPGVECL